MEHRPAPITLGALAASGFHPLVVNTVGAIQNQHARVSNPFTKEGKSPRNEKGEGKEKVGVESEKPLRRFYNAVKQVGHANVASVPAIDIIQESSERANKVVGFCSQE